MAECEHDFRRIYPHDVNPRHRGEGTLAVCCCKCGRSPIASLAQGGVAQGVRVNGDWPEELQITDYGYDDMEGPSVEFKQRGGSS